MIRGGMRGWPAPIDDPDEDRRSLARPLIALAALAALGVLLALVRWELESVHVGGDVFWYTRDALQLAGVPEDAATRQAAELMVAHGRGDDPASYVALVESIDPRYPGIFGSRPFYPVTLAALAPAFELTTAMRLSILVAAALFASTFGWFAQRVTGSLLIGAGMVVLVFALPSGRWFAHLYAEGWMLALWTVGLTMGGLYLAIGRARHLAIALAGLVLLYLTKPANGAVLAVTFALLGLAGAARPSMGQQRGRYLALGASAVTLAVVHLIGLRVLGLPGLTESIQDTFTAHFTRPDVADPYGALVRRNLQLVPAYVAWVVRNPLTPAIVLGLGVLAAVVRGWSALWLLGGVATGLTVLLHPVTTQFERLMAPIWLSAALGMGVAAVAGAAALSRLRAAG